MWEPPTSVSAEAIMHICDEVCKRRDLEINIHEHIVRVNSLGLDWDLGFVTYEPTEVSKIPVGPDGRRVGIFLLHGGSDDFHRQEPLAKLLAQKFGFKVLSGTFPGRFNFSEPDRKWRGDTVRPDGSVRTPIWKIGETISRNEYDVIVRDNMRDRYGTQTWVRARPGTKFFARLSSWPAAFEEGMVRGVELYLPGAEFSVYGQGHSTGGPMMSMLCQRIPNLVGLLSTESSPFGYVCYIRDALTSEFGGRPGKLEDYDTLENPFHRTDAFDEIEVRTWRHEAKYVGPETLLRDGGRPDALLRLPALMEEVFERWEHSRTYPQFKAEGMISWGIDAELRKAASAVADRLGLDDASRKELTDRFVGYTRPLSDPESRPVPPILWSIAANSKDHQPRTYEEIIIPAYRLLDRPPKIRLVKFGAGGHFFWEPEGDLPLGIAPAVAQMWADAIASGYFLEQR